MQRRYFGSTLQSKFEAALADLETETAGKTEIKGIAAPIARGAGGPPAKGLEEALIALGYLDASKATGTYTNDVGLAVKKFIEATPGAVCVAESSNYPVRGCKKVDEVLAQKIDNALAAKGLSASRASGFTLNTAGEIEKTEQSCDDSLKWWQGLAIGVGALQNPCPPPGAATGNSIEEQAAQLALACEAYKEDRGKNIAVSSLVAGISGALLGTLFAENKAQGALIGAAALALLGGGVYSVFKVGQPEGCY